MNSWVTRIFEKSNKSAVRQKVAKPKAANHPYRAVMIYHKGTRCCDAARRIKEQKFLAAHAPQLPLGGCSQPQQCQCRYKHLLDRRQDLRRDADFGLPGRNYAEVERRSRGDRRRPALS